MEAKSENEQNTCIYKYLNKINNLIFKKLSFGTRIEFLKIFQISDRNSQKIQKVPNKVF